MDACSRTASRGGTGGEVEQAMSVDSGSRQEREQRGPDDAEAVTQRTPEADRTRLREILGGHRDFADAVAADDRLREEILGRNRRLADFKRVGGYLLWEKDFPRTVSLKIKRGELAAQIGAGAARVGVVGI